MANEFIARKGLISSGSINVYGSVTASFFKGDGSQLTNLPSSTVLSSSVNIDTYTFNGDGVTTNYLLSQSYDINSLIVSVDGLTQTKNTDYSISASTLIFVDTPPSASNILVRAFVNNTQGVTGSFTGSFFGAIASASYAQTASYALNAQSGGSGAGFPFSGSAVITGSLQVVPTGSVGGITGSFTGSFKGDGSGLTGVTAAGTVSSSAQIDITQTTNYTTFSSSIATKNDTQDVSINALNAATSSYALQSQLAGVASSSSQVKNYLPTDTVSSSTQVVAFLPTGTISSSAQYPGWVTSSAQIDITATTGYTTFSQSLATVDHDQTTRIDNLSSATSSYALQTQLQNVVSSSSQVKEFLPNGTVSSSAQYPGWMTSSTQVVWSQVAYNADIVSSSTQTVANIAGQTIAPAIINATGVISGASIQVSGNGTVGGNLTVTGTLTATSQSIQYISSSQLNVATNKIILNTDSALRFGGLSVIDSGSIGNSGSLLWDSVNDRWIYEDVSGGAYNSAILVAGPKNTSSTGNERGLLEGRVPVASGDDHIDTAAASSSIRVDFPSRLTHVEAGLFVTGNLTANGTVTLQDIPSSSAQIKVLLPDGTVSSSAQYPGWMTASSQVVWSQVAYNANIVSSSTQVQTFLPNGTVSSSGQVSYTGLNNIPAGIVSSSTQVQPLLPDGTVSSSAQYPGWVTASSQVDYTGLQNIPAGIVSSSGQISYTGITNIPLGIVSSSAQVQPLLPLGTVSSSTQVKEYLPLGTVSSSAQYPGWVTASSQVDYNNIANKLSGVVSSSAQVAPLLPNGTVSSSEQYAGWVTSSSQIDYNSIQNKLSGVISSSTQFNALTNTSASYALTASYAVGFTPLVPLSSSLVIDTYTFGADGITTNYVLSQSYDISSLIVTVDGLTQINVSDYTLTGPTLGFVNVPPSGSNVLVRAFVNTIQNMTGSFSGSFLGVATSASFAQTASYALNAGAGAGFPYSGSAVITGSLYVVPTGSVGGITGSVSGALTGTFPYSGLTGIPVDIVSSSTQVTLLLPIGTVSSSTQIDYNSIQNKLSGVISSSTQFNALTGTSASYAATASYATSFTVADVTTTAGISSSNHIVPTVDNTYNLGAPDKRWANMYTGDLVLSNEGSQGNNVDGTTGNWTIQEGEEYLYIINNKSGKKFRFMLAEIE